MDARPIAAADLPALAAFVAADEERLLGRPSRTGVEDLRAWLSRTDLEQDSWLVEHGAGIAGCAWAEAHGEVGVAVVVVPGGGELAAALLTRAEERLAGHGAARVHSIAFAADEPLMALHPRRGYAEVRRFWEMTIELGAPPEVPELPPGLELESFDPAEARAFHAVLEEAFEDHWEHQPRPFEEWWQEKQAAPDYDPTLWFVVRDGDGLAAAARNDPKRSGGGWIGALGVRRPWRGRGLARALLLRSFREFWDRGLGRVGLGVDAANPTGATRLYESVGMHVDVEQVVWEKRL